MILFFNREIFYIGFLKIINTAFFWLYTKNMKIVNYIQIIEKKLQGKNLKLWYG